MSIDMQQFHAVFFEESQEHLDTMEQLLLALDVQNPDIEDLNSIFRAAHSIKGGSGIFGFQALGSLTHILEGLLDRLRSHRLLPDKKMIDVFLSAVDVLKATLDAYRSGSVPDQSPISIAMESLASYESEAVGIDSEDDGFGFFDDESEAAPVDAANDFSDDNFFGFFNDADDLTDPETGLSTDNVSPLQNNVSPHAHPEQDSSARYTAKNLAKKTESQESATVRVDVGKLDNLINLVGEIVITQSMLTLLSEQLDGKIAEKFKVIVDELERNTKEMQEAVMAVRMLPVSFVFNRFPRVVRDLSSRLDKEIDLVIHGEDTELDKGLIEKLVDPLTHLVRNSIDHGIESAEVRRTRNKAERGTVTLEASRLGSSIVINISDDGGGLDRERILAKAQENGIACSVQDSDQTIWQLIFEPGFSTASAVTDVSGRGVGLDVVKRNVAALGGRIEIESRAGEGTRFSIYLPLTLAIVDGMSVSVGQEIFIIPLVNIVECLQPSAEAIKTLAAQDQLLLVRDQYWPVVSLSAEMQIETDVSSPSEGVVVLIESSKKRFALLVDALVGQQQVVIKSLEQHYRRVSGVAGATIMGDGSVALILDVESLAEHNVRSDHRECAA